MTSPSSGGGRRGLESYGRLVAKTERSYGQAAVARCEGLLIPDDAIDDPFQRALARHQPGVLPFERARTQLCYCERLRRARRRVDARDQLHAALATFESLGAPLWVRRACDELAATGGGMRRDSIAARERLTSQERRVAVLVGEGATNPEVAGALFLSTKTVESHLRQVFRKLGLRSRSELVALAARGELAADPGEASPTR